MNLEAESAADMARARETTCYFDDIFARAAARYTPSASPIAMPSDAAAFPGSAGEPLATLGRVAGKDL